MTNKQHIIKPTVGSTVTVVTDHSEYLKTVTPTAKIANRFYKITGVVVPDFPWVPYNHFCVKTSNRYHPVSVISLETIHTLEIHTGTHVMMNDQKDEIWSIVSSKKCIKYQVIRKNNQWSCTCTGFKFHRHCKHITNVKDNVGL